jgi:hypothetical protein
MIEFDIDIKPVKLVKGQGLAKLLANENCKMLGINFVGVDAKSMQSQISEGKLTYDLQVSSHLADCEWCGHIVYFLQNLTAPPDMSKTQVRALKLKAIKFCISDKILFWKDPLGVLLRCINKDESVQIMTKFHSSECGGHHYWKITTHKILRASYYWPSLFFDVCTFVKTCDKCPRFLGKQQLKSLPLKPVVVTGPF